MHGLERGFTVHIWISLEFVAEGPIGNTPALVEAMACHRNVDKPWWRHQMETFSAWLAICAGNSPVPGEFPAQRPVTRSFDVFFDLRLNKRLSKQSWGWWFDTLSRPLWRHCNVSPETMMTLSNNACERRFASMCFDASAGDIHNLW